MDEHEVEQQRIVPKRTAGFLKIASLVAQRLFDSAIDGIGKRVNTIRTELDLFVGALFVTIGTSGFNSDKFCDGNSADYLSCTRPSTYYYFSMFDQILIVLGVLLILLWVVSRRRA